MRTGFLSISACLLAFVPGCREMSIPPAGSYSEVLLVTEDGARSDWVPQLVPLLTKEHDYIVDKESGFRVRVIRAADLEDFPVVKNLVICGVADSGTEVGTRIMGLIGRDGMDRVQTGGANILKKENLPAPGQLTVIITGRNNDELQAVIQERGGELAEILEASCRARLRRHLLTYQNKQITADLYRKYGFVIEVPSLYHLLSDESDPPGVELIREPPTRILGVFWLDWDRAPSMYDVDALFEARSKYIWERYDADKMEPERVTYAAVRFGPYEAIEMQGYWYNTRAVAGGYFKTYFIYDEDSELLWAVDMLTYAPGRDKHPLFRELLALAETFRYN